MYEKLIEDLFSLKDYTVYGFDYTNTTSTTVITGYCWRKCKPELNILFRGVIAKKQPVGRQCAQTFTTSLPDHPTFYKDSHSSYAHHWVSDTNAGGWLNSISEALELVRNAVDAPFANNAKSKFPRCSCGRAMVINAKETSIYTCHNCKVRFFWHPQVVMLNNNFATFKEAKEKEEEKQKPTVKFTDPKGKDLEIELGECGHVWVPLREGKACPTCFTKHMIFTQLHTLDTRLISLEAHTLVCEDTKSKETNT